MFTSGLFWTVFVSVLVLFFVGNRVTEGSKGEFGRKTVRFIMEKLEGDINPRFLLCLICAIVAFNVAYFEYPIVDLSHDYGNWPQMLAMVIGAIFLWATGGFILTFFYYFLERLAEIFTYYWGKIWELDLTKKSRLIAILIMVAMAAGLVKTRDFDKRLVYLGRHDRTIVWVRKIAKERRDWLERRNRNQEALRESRLKWDLRHQI